MKVKTAQKVLS
jgi:hypothetical protein